MLDKLENDVNELALGVKSAVIPDVTEGAPDPATGEPRLTLSYGYVSAVLKDIDTLESLANEYFGDPDRAVDIAAYNGIAALNELAVGDPAGVRGPGLGKRAGLSFTSSSLAPGGAGGQAYTLKRLRHTRRPGRPRRRRLCALVYRIDRCRRPASAGGGGLRFVGTGDSLDVRVSYRDIFLDGAGGNAAGGIGIEKLHHSP